jgi:hypothetical protein
VPAFYRFVTIKPQDLIELAACGAEGFRPVGTGRVSPGALFTAIHFVQMKSSPSRSPQGARRMSSRPLGSAFTHLTCFGLGILLTAGIGLFAWHHGPEPRPLSSSAHPPIRAAQAPWGEIESTAIDLERPDDSFSETSESVPPTTWFFRDFDERKVEALLRAAGLTPEQQRLLADKSRWRAQTNGWLILPAPEVIGTLAPEARRHIYSVLSLFPENPLHQNPARFAATEFDGWLAQSGVPDDKKQLFRSLTYRDGDRVLFADFDYLETQCSRHERKIFARAISRSPCLYMKLRVRPETDVDALLRYWGRGGQGKAIRPFLESLTHVPGGASIGVTFFFPEFARLRLYTYPDPATDRAATREDCFWTAMNFFNQKPDARFFDPAFLRQTLDSDYVRVATNWAFGDVIAVADAEGQPIHMCVYVADDVVFTKNGLDTIEPWRLIKIREMMKTYGASGTEQLVGFRRKNLANL